MMISGPGTELEGDPGVATMSAIAETGAAPKSGRNASADNSNRNVRIVTGETGLHLCSR